MDSQTATPAASDSETNIATHRATTAMLDVKALTELLSENHDARLCKRWYLMTANGTLLAYSKPTHIITLRRHAALAALSWQEHDRTGSADYLPREFEDELREDLEQSPLSTLIIESDSSNLIVRRVQPQLLLVLEGGVPPGAKRQQRKVTAENLDGSHRGLHGTSDEDAASQEGSHPNASVANDVLQLQRRKLDALGAVIIKDFDHSGFRMPDEAGTTIF